MAGHQDTLTLSDSIWRVTKDTLDLIEGVAWAARSVAMVADARPRLRSRFSDIGGTVIPGSPADFGKLIADETEKWRKVVKFAGIKAE